jgi:hypothetical protein
MTDDSYQIDVGGHFWSPEERDYELGIIDDMIAQLQATIHKFIQLKRAQAEANEGAVSEAERSALATRGVLWPKMKLACFKSGRRRNAEKA